jgi:[ribosomal protein S5]-alanine N-acetyltransferase
VRAVVDTLLNTETALKEVFAEVVGWAMGQDTMWRIGDLCDAENLASARIM